MARWCVLCVGLIDCCGFHGCAFLGRFGWSNQAGARTVELFLEANLTFCHLPWWLCHAVSWGTLSSGCVVFCVLCVVHHVHALAGQIRSIVAPHGLSATEFSGGLAGHDKCTTAAVIRK